RGVPVPRDVPESARAGEVAHAPGGTTYLGPVPSALTAWIAPTVGVDSTPPGTSREAYSPSHVRTENTRPGSAAPASGVSRSTKTNTQTEAIGIQGEASDHTPGDSLETTGRPYGLGGAPAGVASALGFDFNPTVLMAMTR